MMKLKFKHIISILFFLLAINSLLFSQDWIVPADKKAIKSPVKFNDKTIKAGETVYLSYCKSCHGDPGKANFLKLTPPPGDFATDIFQKQTDGELFYRITTGKGPMPQFRNILKEEDRWNAVSFIRSFNKKYVQPTVEIASPVAKSVTSGIKIKFLEKTKQISVTVTDTSKGTRIPVKNAEASLFVKRYFGNLKIGESQTTDENGFALFDFPGNIPGDKKGNVNIIVKLKDEQQFGDVHSSMILPLGIPVSKPPLNEERAMWNVESKAPYWILITYIAGVISVWSFLIYIIKQLFKLKSLGT